MRINKLFFLLVFIFFQAVPFVISCNGQSEESYPNAFTVTRVVDGDTIVLDDGEKVRLIGVDCFPVRDGSELDRLAKKFGEHNREAIKAFGKLSTEFTQKLCEGKRVRLEYGKDRRDRFERLLAYVYLPAGKLLNEEIILNGDGFYYGKYPFKQELMDRFERAEKEAEDDMRGMWKFLKGF